MKFIVIFFMTLISIILGVILVIMKNQNNISLELERLFFQQLSTLKDTANKNYCETEGLEPYNEVRVLDPKIIALYRTETEGYIGDDLANYAIKFAENEDIKISDYKRDKIVMYFFDKAASQNSTIAFAEIGASLLYCYQHVEQDLPYAEFWLRMAAEANDPYAMFGLAQMYLKGYISAENAQWQANKLFASCSKMGHQPCINEFKKIRFCDASFTSMMKGESKQFRSNLNYCWQKLQYKITDTVNEYN